MLIDKNGWCNLWSSTNLNSLNFAPGIQWQQSDKKKIVFHFVARGVTNNLTNYTAQMKQMQTVQYTESGTYYILLSLNTTDTFYLRYRMMISLILLQIVMVSPGTHLVKNHESQSRTNESQFKNQWVPGSLCNHTVNLKTDSKTLYYSLLK